MPEDLTTKWKKVQELLLYESDIAKVSYKAFLEKLEPIDITNNTLTIEAENDIAIDVINKRFLPELKVAIKDAFNKDYTLDLIVAGSNPKRKFSHTIPKLKSNNNSNLNDRYTFDTFVVGNNNRYANAAALAVAESPAKVYNPFFIYGGVGLGKTHLMQSIAHFILEQNSNMKVLYVTSEVFTNELINSIRTEKNEEFRNKYRNIDVLIVDDIQFIAGKETTQEEFFHTFNVLYEAKKQIIISSDRPPKEIETLEERLSSRFAQGLIVDIQPPDFETRMAILRNKCDLESLNIDDKVLQYVASNIKSNIRELEGAVNKIVSYSRLVTPDNTEISQKVAEEALSDIIKSKEEHIVTTELILDVVSQHFGIDKTALISKRRSRDIAQPRQIIMYLSRKLTDASLPLIGSVLGKRDHTTILYGHDKIAKDLKTNITLQKQIELLEKKIKGN